MSTLLKAIYRSKVIPIKIPMEFFTEIEKTIVKFIWNYKESRIVNTNLKGKNKIGTLTQFQNALQSYSNQDNVGTDIRIDIEINGIETGIGVEVGSDKLGQEAKEELDFMNCIFLLVSIAWASFSTF